MSYTPVQNRFWSDGWVRLLNPLDRYLVLYVLTNGRARLTGIYELPIDLMAAESGIDHKDLQISMLPRLEPKIYYREGWVIIVNYLKHRVSDSPKYLQGIINEFEALPQHIQEIAKSYGYPIDTLPIPNRIRIDKKRIDTSVAEAPRVVSDSEEDERPARVKRNTAYKQVFSLFSKKPQGWMLHKPQIEAAKRLLEMRGLPQIEAALRFYREHKDEPFMVEIDTPFDLEAKWSKLVRKSKV